MRLFRFIALAVVLLASPSWAQEPPADFVTITTKVTHGVDKQPVGDAPVFLRAARPRGPFEPTAPPIQQEWEGFTDVAGVATFSRVPRALATSGLRLHAVTTHDGMAFTSPAVAALDGAEVSLTVWDKSLDTSVVEIENLRSTIEIWENYLVFTQFYTLTNTGTTALDTRLLPDDTHDKGIAFDLPVKAQAINVMGPGASTVVNSTFYWHGTLQPHGKVNLQVRFSMSARDPDFTYEQTVAWPTKNVEVVVPIQTRFTKLPRLDSLQLLPPGFEETDRGAGIFGLRSDIDFVGARGLELQPGQSFAFQLRGLPFHRPRLPWAFLVLGVLASVAIFLIATRQLRAAGERANRDEMLAALESRRVQLLDELVELQRDLLDGILTQAEFDFESSALREQLALVLKKLEDLERAHT